MENKPLQNEFVLFKKRITSKEGKEMDIWSGKANWNNQDFELSGFLNKSASGVEYFKGKCKEPYNKPMVNPDQTPMSSVPF